MTTGDSETGRARDRSKSRARRAAVSSLESRRKGALGMVQGVSLEELPLSCLLLPGGWLLGSLGVQEMPARSGGGMGSPRREKAGWAFRGDLRGGGPCQGPGLLDWSAPVLAAGAGVAPWSGHSLGPGAEMRRRPLAGLLLEGQPGGWAGRRNAGFRKTEFI